MCIRCRRESNWAIYGAGRPEGAARAGGAPPPPAPPRPAASAAHFRVALRRPPLRGPVETAPAPRPPRAAGSLVEPTARASPGPCRARAEVPAARPTPRGFLGTPKAAYVARAPPLHHRAAGRAASTGVRGVGLHRGACRLPACSSAWAASPLDVVRLCTPASFPSGSRRGSGQSGRCLQDCHHVPGSYPVSTSRGVLRV
ncbi:Dedicator Of Cytokinesis Protein 4 [Manis pentadactyla]|nr:Dedicator Of Cytokinesis Protein 4 [Manis pentadactyla]